MSAARWLILVVLVVSLGAVGWLWFQSGAGADHQTYIREGMIRCLDSRENFWRGSCIQELQKSMQERMSTQEALRALAVLDDEPRIKQTCHALVHYIGQSVYREYGDVPKSFNECSKQIACGEGCYHGVVEAYMQDTGDLLQGDAAANLCRQDFAENQITYRACNHGIGHSLMLLSDGDVPQSLKQCDVLKEDLRDDCYSGVFMENVFGNWDGSHPNAYSDPNDLNYPCTILDEPYLDMCYQSQASMAIFSSPRRYLAAADFCAQVPVAHRMACYREPGGDVVVMSDEPEALHQACLVAPEGAARAGCFHEGLYYAIQMKSGDTAQVAKFCNAMAPGQERTSCYQALGDVLAQWDFEGAQKRCESVTQAGSADAVACIEGTNITLLE